jgi:hypothetical protein
MTRRRYWLVCAAALLALCVSAALLGRAPARRLDVSAFGRVEAGMTEAEVERLLGVPAGDYGSWGLLAPVAPRMAAGEKAWCDDEEVLFVRFDGGAVAEVKHMSWNLDPSMRGVRGFFLRLRRRLGL